MRKDLAHLLLRELLKNSKRSDRDLAGVLGVSQPTITRTRHKLEQEGVIHDYTVVPDFRKMGFELLALTFVKMRPEVLTPEVMKKTREYAAKFPNAIFSAAGEGLGMTGVIISFHKSYTDYHKKVNLLRVDWKDITEDVQTFVVSIGENETKSFSLTYLGDMPL
jgi:DNA-binding Lrp family transcriptional regulator